MPDPFADDLSGRGPLIHAYNLVPDPKPSLAAVIGYINEGKLPAVRIEDFWYVRSVIGFAEALETLMKEMNWNPIFNVVMPAGYVPVLAYIRDHSNVQLAKEAGLIVGNGKGMKGLTLSTFAKSLVSAGDLDGCKKGPRNQWIAPPDKIRAWAHRHWKLEVR